MTGAANPIGSNMADEVCRILRSVGFFLSDPEFSSAQ